MRCVQPAEYLAASGWRTRAGCIYRTLPAAGKAVVFHRAILDAHTRAYLAYARARGLVTVYDTDDLIFSLQGNNHLKSFFSPGQSTEEQFDLSEKYRAAMRECDVVTVSTSYLKHEAEKFHPDVRLARNGLAEWFQRKADTCVRERVSSGARAVTIGYLSGSKHHDDDFKLVEDELIALLESVPSARLLLAGKLNFSDRFHRFGERFQHRPFVLYQDFWEVFRDIDINIVPLRTEDPFVQARSEIKYTEAGIFGIPTVASPSGTYAEAIRDGENGLLANDSAWFETLKSLLLDERLRTAIGQAARADVKARYGNEARTTEWNEMMTDIVRRYSQPSASNVLASAYLYLGVFRMWAARMLKIGGRSLAGRAAKTP